MTEQINTTESPDRGRPMDEMIELANAYYEQEKSVHRDHTVTISLIERRLNIPAGKLRSFRANRKRRRYSGVTTFFRAPNS